MMKLTTAGESHGKGLFAILEGIPAGLFIQPEKINLELSRRQSGYGRSSRQKIECDRAEILSGVIDHVTLGSPIALAVWNRDFGEIPGWTRPRPGHADYAGALKYGTDDMGRIAERASARETAVRVAAGGICRALLERLGIFVTGFVRSIGEAETQINPTGEEILSLRTDFLGMIDREGEKEAAVLIDRASALGESLGGTVELRIIGLKSGFGSCMVSRERLGSRLTAAMTRVQGVKGTEIGFGFCCAERLGSEVHDELFLREGKIVRKTNRAGGIEGGMSNGEEIVLRAAMKPLPTLARGLRTVDLGTKTEEKTPAVRSDVCAVPACEVVLEAEVCCELCSAVLERLGGDRVDELIERYGRLP